MWCGFEKSRATIAAVCLVTASVFISDMAFAARHYTPKQFRAVLHGLGYKIKVSDAPLTDAEAKAAIKEFQQGYKLKPADGVAGTKTEDYAAQIIEILQANLNLVLKPKSPLPRNQYYGSQTEAAVKQYQKKNQLQETGIADLALRQKLDKEAENLISNPTSTPAKKPSTKPKATPSASPTETSTPTASPEATSTPTASPTVSPTVSPTESPTATPTATPTTTPTSHTKPKSKPKTKS